MASGCTVDGRTATLGLVAEKSVRGWQLHIDDFRAVLPRTPAFAQLMLRVTVRSARIHNLLYRSALLMATGERLAIAMLFMARHATVTVDGEQGVLIEVTQDMLAQLVGISRQCVCKHLRQWEQSGWIALQYGGIRLINQDGLAAQHQALERLLAF
jgi:CRP-like cAMP-binding protein